MRILHIRREQNFCNDNQKIKFVNCSVHPKPVFNPPFIPSAYSENMRKVFKRLWRIRQLMAAWGTQNRLRIHGKNLCVHGEDAKIHKTEDISVNKSPTWNFLDPYFLYKVRWIKPKNHFTLFFHESSKLFWRVGRRCLISRYIFFVFVIVLVLLTT